MGERSGPEKIDVLGVPIGVLNLGDACQRVLNLAAGEEGGYVCIAGAHGIVEAQSDPTLRRAFCESLFNTPDGMPVVWTGRWLHGKRHMGRVYGPDLMAAVFEHGQKSGVRHFLYGGKEGVAEQLRDRLLKRFPQANIVGTYTPPFRPLNAEEEADLLRQWEDTKPDLVWVGLSTPKQDLFMAEMVKKTSGLVFLGVGAAFDFHAGLMPTAPPALQRAGLEWFYRLVHEPARLWPRYRKAVPGFLWGTFLQWTGLKRFGDD